MKNKRHLLGLFFLIILSLSCKRKQDDITVSGKLIDPNQGIDIEGVTVDLWAQKIESGIYSAHYDNYGSELTDAKGEFSFSLENNTYASVKLSFSKKDYYFWEYEIDGDAIKNNYLHNKTYQMQAKSWIEITIKNENPFDSQDYFDLRIMNGFTDCEFCCTGETLKFYGTDVEQVIICQMIGHADASIRWNAKKGGQQTGDVDLIFLPSFDTTRLEYHY